VEAQTIENFIDSIHRAHLDNAKTSYKASPRGASVSPLTNFVFETFLFNSLYSVDWIGSFEQQNLVWHDVGHDGPSESKKQRELLKFCRQRLSDDADFSRLNNAFQPLLSLGDLSASWASVTPDARISLDDGEAFFAKLTQLSQRAANNELSPTKKDFDVIQDCCHFVYLVRNNIFHGQKTLGDIYDRDQLRRITVYDLFLRCLNSLFFVSVGKPDFGSAYAQFPVTIPSPNKSVEITPERLVRLVNRPEFGLKQEDSFLHHTFINETENHADGNPRDSLFYPSSGRDILFPLIVGLPFCTDFYFYEISRLPKLRDVESCLRTIEIKEIFEVVGEDKDESVFEFSFDSIDRRLRFCRKDNLEFMKLDIPLRFYFHRGDSPGEGGSGQNWDSELLPELAKSNQGLFVLTDGEPGGLPDSISSCLKMIRPPNSHRERDYYLGCL